MSCSLTSPVSCVVGPIISDSVSDAATSVWDQICKSFADAASSLLKEFAKAFVAIPDVDLSSRGLRNVYAISLGLATFIAVLLLLGQVVRTAVTHDGSPLATGLVGVGKAALAFMLTLTVASTALVASDEVSSYIVRHTFGSTKQFSDKLAKLIAWDPGVSGSLLLIFGVIGILLTAVLWFEMLLRNAAIAILIGTSPLAAAGMISEETKGWWSKLVGSTVQLIALKPMVALVFALGFGLAGDSQDLETTLSGMLVLLLAVLCWPAIARFFSFASVQTGGAAGLGALLGFAGGRLSARADGGGAPVGVSPDQFGMAAAGRTAARHAGMAQGAGAAAVAGPVGLIASTGVRAAQQAVNSLAGGFDKMAGHAGMQGAQPHAAPAGQVPRSGTQPVTSSSGWQQQPTARGAWGQSGTSGGGAHAAPPTSAAESWPEAAADSSPSTRPLPADPPSGETEMPPPPPPHPAFPDQPTPPEGDEPQ